MTSTKRNAASIIDSFVTQQPDSYVLPSDRPDIVEILPRTKHELPLTVVHSPAPLPQFAGYVEAVPSIATAKPSPPGRSADTAEALYVLSPRYVLDFNRIATCKREVGKLAAAGQITHTSGYALGSSLFYLAGHTRKRLPNDAGLSAKELYAGYRLFTPPYAVIKNIDEPTFRTHLEVWASANSMLHAVRDGYIDHVFDIEMRNSPLTFEETQIFIEGMGCAR